MARDVVGALNKLSDQTFTERLTDRDREALSDFLEDYFCAPDDQDEEIGSYKLH